MRGAVASIAEMAAKVASRGHNLSGHRGSGGQQYKNLLAPSRLSNSGYQPTQQTSAPPELKSHYIAESRFS